jgi:hypothetical protein
MSDKAYDLKDLAVELKAEGLELAEDAAESVYKGMKSWLKKSAAKSATPIDDLVFNFLDQLDPIVMPAIDKINKEDNH